MTAGPLPVVGHSKGGSVMVQFAAALPHRVSALVNLDGVPSGRSMPDVPDHERTKLLAGELAGWLDFRRQTATKQRRPDTIDGLAERRGRMNPRLSKEWLRYLVSVGARHDDDGLALDDRPVAAARRLRPLAARVGHVAPAGAERADPGGAGPCSPR